MGCGWMLSGRGGPENPGAVPQRHHPGFLGRRLLLWLAILAVVAAALLIHAGGTAQRPDPTTAKSQAVLVAIRGTDASTSGPGIAAFVAVIQPKSRSIGILPVSGTLATQEGPTLAEAAPSLSAGEIAANVATDLGIKLSGYIVIDGGVVENVIATLQQGVPEWPLTLTPQQALADLGWPNARPDRKGQVQVLTDLISYVPQLQGGDSTVLAGEVLQGSSTRLSMYDLFVLVTYVNDQKVAPIRLRNLPKTLFQKRVTP